VIVCPKCSKENQDHYKFCLGCGAELPRGAAPAPKKASQAELQGIGPSPVIEDEATSLGTGAPGEIEAGMAPPAAQTVACPQCGHVNGTNNKFCASCGFKLAKPASIPAPSAAQGGGVTITALRADGTEAGAYPLPAAGATIGRNTGSIFAGDSYLSPRHATFSFKSTKLFVKDEGSLNGVYRKLRPDEPVVIKPNEVFRIGQEIIRYEPLAPAVAGPDGVERLGSPSKGYVGRIAMLIGRDVTGNAYPLPETGIHLGRERGDVLFPEDGYVSGLHCRIAVQNGIVTLTDLGSSNGSFARLSEETEVHHGDILLMGQQLFRITMA